MSQESMVGKIVVMGYSIPESLNAPDWLYKVIAETETKIQCEIVDWHGKTVNNRWERPVHYEFYKLDVREVGA